MMKRYIAFALIAVCLATLLAGCGEKKEQKILHCDNCGKECKVAADSPMEEDWIVYCADCEKKLGLDKIVKDGDMPFAQKQSG